MMLVTLFSISRRRLNRRRVVNINSIFGESDDGNGIGCESSRRVLVPFSSRRSAFRRTGGRRDYFCALSLLLLLRNAKTTQREKAGGDHKLVRTNPTKNMASLDAFYRKTTTAPPLEVATPLAEGERGASEAMLSRRTSTALLEEVRRNVRARRNRPTKEGGAMNDVAPYYTDLTSVLEICELIREQKHEQISEMLHSHTVVGPADVASGKWLIQHRTKLLMINVNAASRQLMYQLVFAKFNGFKSIAISPPARLCDLCEMSSSSATKSVNDAADADAKKKFFEKVVEVLLPRATMLKEYFGITIEKIVSSSSNDNESTKGEEDVVISTLPEILDGHSPDLSRLPEFVDSLCSKVD